MRSDLGQSLFRYQKCFHPPFVRSSRQRVRFFDLFRFFSIFTEESLSSSILITIFSFCTCCGERFFALSWDPHVLCVDTGRSSETAKAHRG
eukprot:TRINITY_DN10111_c0_g1_i1.p1 TRINITY_DN10111_c0_g1~~TRINITY_DN10111_c0_g1_i1.p1  ORF type:complete len:91 (+),score=10.24 TRINITY_DN10111_c0_g1_i1:168-440(+)